MHVTVYRTRQRGVRLPSPQAGVHGRLRVETWRDGYTRQLAAKLVDESEGDRLLLPELLHAQVRRITPRGIVISGLEVVPRRNTNKSSADRYSQTWWCLVHTLALGQYLDVVDPAEHPLANGTPRTF